VSPTPSARPDDATKTNAEGIYWVRTNDHSPVGRVGDPAVEAKLQNMQRARINLVAILVVAVVTAVLVKGISESAGFNAAMVFIKLAAVVFVILVGAFFVKPSNWVPFAPYGWTGVSILGYPILCQTNAAGDRVGMMAGAA